MSVPVANQAVYFKNIAFEITKGRFRYGSFGALPATILSSDDPSKFRVWNLNLVVDLEPIEGNEYTILIDGTKINPKPVTVSFEDELTGIVVYKNKVFDANKCVTFDWNSSDPFRILLKFTPPCSIRKPTLVNFTLSINDSNMSPNCPCQGATNCGCCSQNDCNCKC